MSSGRDDEQAPLLADDARDDEADSVEDTPRANSKVPKQEKPRIWLHKSWHWLSKNIKTAAIVLLLLGGIVALVAYFAGVFHLAPAPALTKVRFLVAYNQNNRDPDPEVPGVPDTVCLTPACVVAASNILQNMSPRYHTIDPCDDFDQFVCEGWQEKHDLRADQGAAFTGTIMEEDSQQILRHVLESPYSIDEYKIETDSSAKRDIFEKLQTAYNACMDENLIKGLGSAPLLDVLRKVEELFPAARPDTHFLPFLKTTGQESVLLNSEDHLSKTLTYLTSIGMDPLISLLVTVCSRNHYPFGKLILYRLTTKIQMLSFLL